ncbi:HAD family hydrolase [Paenibacillus sp. HN-1]|uniref:HAD family hydrolase n=1 Tax=Paenibacillus TaxID=44249 RepID=UPI001CA96541|nr:MULTISPECIES: HAD family hydrolase [Paenibacillus]MBY9079759.1 HAD family hydrolase [Paenibacillus sp. CGMCC 1.18879]MBY9084403.1 HAD family hydrolase [Paenibacillus sinensis]
MIKALIFDFDGTIIDTETAWYTAFNEAYREHGVELTLEQYSTCIGTSLNSFNPYEYLMTELNLPIDKEAFRVSVRARHRELMELQSMRPGIQRYLDACRKTGLKIGLASSSSAEWVETYLNQLGIRGYFDCIRTSDHVKQVKPDPELYLQALSCLGVSPDEAVAIEDSPNGARAAAAAGMKCVVTPNEITSFLTFDTPHHKIESLDLLDFEHVITRRCFQEPGLQV